LWHAVATDAFAADIPGRVVAHDRDGVYVSCAQTVLQVTELQFAGRKRCSAAQALNARDLSGCLLGKRA
jgi:methionyl-tRNA formyltransferase